MSDLLRTLLQQASPEEKTRVLVELAREAIQSQGTTPIPLRDDGQNTVGYLTATRDLSALIPTDPAWIAEQRRRLRNPGRTLSPEEFLKELNRE